MIWVTYLSISDHSGEPFIHHALHLFDDILQFITSYRSGNVLEAVNYENVNHHNFKA